MNDRALIAEAFAAIAEDDRAQLVAAALVDAWDGQTFDDKLLRAAFEALRVPVPDE